MQKVVHCRDAVGQICGHSVWSEEQREKHCILFPPQGPDSIVHERYSSWAHVEPSKFDQVGACHTSDELNNVHGCRGSEVQSIQCLWLNSHERHVSEHVLSYCCSGIATA